MSQDGGTASADYEGFTIESNTSTKQEILDSVSGKGASEPRTAGAPEKEPETEEEKRSKAATELGKAGGKASAEKRAAEAAEADKKPIKPKGKEAAEGEKAEEGAEPKKGEADEGKEKPDKPRHDPQARMLEATRKEAEAKRERDQVKAELEELRARYESLQKGEKREAKADAAPAKDAKPDPKNYEDYESYLDARDAWNKGQLVKEFHEERQRQEAVESQDRVLTDHINRFRAHVTSEVLASLSEDVKSLKAEFQLGPGEKATAENWIANELVFSPETAPTLMRYFSEHPDELWRIAALPNPRAVMREMGKLEGRIERVVDTATDAIAAEEEISRSKASPPIKPVAGAAYIGDGEPYKPGMSFDDYLKRNRKDFKLPR